jgi:legumain
MLVLALLVSCIVAAAVGEDHWALLVAGSNGYDNYRHQADICHAYHVVRSHGIPDERIIVMMYDDIANSTENPFPGNIINRPDGPNVYPGVLKDYTGDDVTPEVFLKVLTGDSKGIKTLLGREGKVIKSGPDDRIFVNFADHGGPGILAFPNDDLQAKDLIQAIKSMHENKQYKQMVFYVEACESGSMFAHLLASNINVFATTAANPDESSYACYYDEKRETYLGDVYSVMWMEDSDKEDLSSETLQGQFKIVREETNTSHVMEYGDLIIGSKKVGDFQGNLTAKSMRFFPTRKQHPTEDAVPSEDVAMHILKKKLEKASGDEVIRHRAALQALLQRKQATEEFFKNVVGLVTKFHLYDTFLRATIKFSDFKCYEESLRLIKELCPGMRLVQNDYALRKLRVLANMCEVDIPKEKIWAAIGKVSYESSICGITM